VEGSSLTVGRLGGVRSDGFLDSGFGRGGVYVYVFYFYFLSVSRDARPDRIGQLLYTTDIIASRGSFRALRGS